MKKQDFPLIELSSPGQYRVVDDATLEQILSVNRWVHLLNIPSEGPSALSFTIRYFRDARGLSFQELAELSGIHRNQLRRLEDANLKTKPHRDTLVRLGKIYGEKFILTLKEQGLF